VRGVWTGFSRQLSFIAALVLAFIVAGRFYLYFSGFFAVFISSPQLAFLLTYLFLFGVVYVAVIFVGLALKKLMKVSMLGGFDRFLGGMFGMGKGIFLLILVFMVLAGFLANSAPFLKKSYFYPFLNSGSRVVMSFINDPGLRSSFMPKEPAIPSIFAEDSVLSMTPPRMATPKHQQALDELRYQLAKEVGERPSR
jgi:membrane protein required for colicin V production